MENMIQGVGVALVTPFGRDGEVDYDALGRLVEHVTAGGVDYLVALGTTGEPPTLTAEERRSVVACIRERNAGRLPVVLGLGGYCTAELLQAIKTTDLSGISAILSVTPYYNKPSQEGLFRHYEAVAGESPVPVMLYNVPARTGTNMEAETTLRIATEVDNVLGIKEACGTVRQMSAILAGRPEGFKVISGDDCMALPLAAIGGDGVISVAANAFPKEFAGMVHAAYEGRREEAAAMYLRLLGILDAIFEEGNPVGVKAALAIKGLTENNVRLPLVRCTPRLEEKMRSLMKRYELWA